MKRILGLIATLVMLALTIVPTAGAQISDSNDNDLAKYGDKVTSAYGRMWMGDTMAAATPDANAPMMAGVEGVTIDSKDDAAKIFDEQIADLQKSLEATPDPKESDGVTSVKLEQADKLGDKAYVLTGSVDLLGSGQATPFASYLFVKDAVIYTTTAIGGDAQTLARDLAMFMNDAKIGDANVVFKEDGTSTGGVFDAMPTAKDVDALAKLPTVFDFNKLDMGTPAS